MMIGTLSHELEIPVMGRVQGERGDLYLPLAGTIPLRSPA
jgi:hypothetical protein